MNERAQQLYEQAHDVETKTLYFVCCPTITGLPEQVSREEVYKTFNVERFIELIVKECILTIQMGITRDGHNTEKYLRSMKHIKQIREHFGIKE